MCSCARAPQEIEEKSLVPAEPSQPEDVSNSIVRVVSPPDLRGFGNGFFVARDKIATNIHLIAGANPVSAHVRVGGATRSIEGVTAYDLKNNLVILKVSIEGTPLPLGDSDAVKIGDTIFDARIPVIKFKNKTEQGTILGVRDNDAWFSTTLDPDPDVSGAPVLNSEREVIGIEVIEGAFGYAISSNTLKVLLAEPDTVEPLAQWQERDAIQAYSYVAQAKRKFRDDDYSEMIDALNEAITLNREFADAYATRGEAKLYLGKSESEKGIGTATQRHYRSAIDDFNKALQLNPESAAAYQNRGYTHRLLANSEADMGTVSAQQHYRAAIDDYTQAIERMPNDVVSYTERGTARKDLSQLESETGDASEAQSHYRAAIEDYTDAIELKPDYASAYYGRGLVKEMLGQQDEAKVDLEKAKTLKREQATVRIGGRDHLNGTGFFVARNKVATNVHVAAQPRPVLIQSVDHEKIWTVAGVTAFDVKNDLAILRVVGGGTPLPLGDSDTLQSGEVISAVGYPKGKYTVSTGTLHSVRDSNKWLQMNVKISPGNSGSPVINSKGQVIGIVSATEEPYSYAIPSNALKALLTESGSGEPLALWRERGPILVYVHSSQGIRNYIEGHYDQAIADFDKVIKVNPENTHAYYNRGLAKFRLGDLESEKGNTEIASRLYEGGVEDSTQAIQQDPEDPNAYHNRAGGKFRLAHLETDIAKKQEYYQGAIHDWTQAIQLNPALVDPQLNPENATAYGNRGTAKAALGNAGGAIEDFDAAIRLDPENAEYFHERGLAKEALGQTEAAKADFEKAKGLDPDVGK